MVSLSKNKYKYYFIFFFLILFNVDAKSQSNVLPFLLSDTTEKLSLGYYLSVLEDPSNELTFEQLRNVASPPLAPSTTEVPNFGISKSSFWAVFSFTYIGAQEKEFWLEHAYPLIDQIELYVVDANGNVSKRVAGDNFKFSQREIDHQNFIFKLHVVPQGSYTCYMKINGTSSLSFPLYLWSPTHFVAADTTAQIGLGIYYGIAIAMILYNLFLFFSLRDSTYIVYVACIISITVFLLTMNGLAYRFLWGNQVWWNSIAVPFLVGMMAVTLLTFNRRFLELKAYLPILDKFMLWFSLITALIPIASLIFGYRPVISAAIVTGLLVIVSCVTAGILSLKKGFVPARFFMIAWSAFLIGMTLQVFRIVGILPTTFITNYASQIGSAMEVILLSLALADRINILKSEIARKKLEQEEEKKNLIELQRRELEAQVILRTAEVVSQKEELERQHRQIELQNTHLQQVLHQSESTNRKLTDSIRYAKRIQSSLIPEEYHLNLFIPQHFVFFAPRDIVSGDFYWSAKVGNEYVLAVADCTGHGVPGALMSLIGASLLSQIVNFSKITSPAVILNTMAKDIEKVLKQRKQNISATRDGMDIALVRINHTDKTLTFAGAKSYLFFVQNDEFFELKGNNAPVGGGQVERIETYQEHIISFFNPTTFYLFSDGYTDQFGGEDNKKFSRKRLRELVKANYHLSMEEQRKVFEKAFFDWKQDYVQLDDVTLIGFRL